MTDTLYDQDFVVWTERQAEALRELSRAGSNLPLDWENLAEEIESVGRSARREVRSLVEHIVVHLLKLAHSPATDPRAHWESEIEFARRRLSLALKDSPSLRPGFSDLVAASLAGARRDAIRSLEAHGETSAAESLRLRALILTADDVLDQTVFLPKADPH